MTMTLEKSLENKCAYCKKEFKSERTLSAHLCPKKRRMLDKETTGSRIGFTVFQRFYKLSTNAKHEKSFEDFINSKYYTSFVKFGRHLVDLNPIDTNSFVDYVIKNGISIDEWCNDKVYFMFLKQHIENETVERAIERTILEMDEWCKQNNSSLASFFTDIGSIEATFLIKSGRISPWVLYLSESGDNLVGRLSEEQANIIQEIIDPNYWGNYFSTHKNDVIFTKNLLKSAGI